MKRFELLRRGYCKKYTDYICVDAIGELIKPNYVTDHFKVVLKEHGLRPVRFHDLRHTYAVISIKNGDDIKTVQNNLGHATASFTLDVYGHVTEQMKSPWEPIS